MERYIRSLKEECLDRMILFGEKSLRKAIQEFVSHYHAERNHQGLNNGLIEPKNGVGQVAGALLRLFAEMLLQKGDYSVTNRHAHSIHSE